ncbi:hypothetical protein [Janibacter melonis]|uniref:hypothetical protein n=1 Tax=Janibacter melonis TaxID=262209 RepID=UPI0020950780|nr:hypothetical protein [Janibacter melonis]
MRPDDQTGETPVVTGEGQPVPERVRRRRRRGAPMVWRWIGTGAIIGFALLGAYAMTSDNVNEATRQSYSATTAVGFMGMLGACIGALVAAVVLALVMGRDRR